MKFDTYGVGIFFPLGSLNDPINKNGTYHLLEHLLFEKNDTEKLKQNIHSHGGIYNGFTSFEIMGFFSQVMKNNKDSADCFISSFLTDFEMNEEKLDNEKKIVEQELTLISQNIFNKNKQFLYNSLGNEGQAILGNIDSLKNITLKDLEYAHNLLKSNYIIANSEDYIANSLKVNSKELKIREIQQNPFKTLLLNKIKSTNAIVTFAFYLPKIFDIVAEKFISYFYHKLFLLLREKYQIVYRGEKNKILTSELCLYSFSFQINEKDIEKAVHIFNTVYYNVISSPETYNEIKKNNFIETNRKLLSTDNPIGYVKRLAINQIMETKQNNSTIEELIEKLELYTPSMIIYSSNEKMLSKGFELYEV
ncbi:insulinase family protein [Listeria monocytogenes]|nr:insulinase family protein [Listeria monocytogenes]EAC8000776.1 insulinase family protein [Listeria monocytogenes]EAD0740610.1 insulinase family protein [Listeria monocytogenes]EAD0740708.1 insulinase family protein [Listeria monocytogenes]EAD7292782.1 insulinase family protein [Listeria monocytogenes]